MKMTNVTLLMLCAIASYSDEPARAQDAEPQTFYPSDLGFRPPKTAPQNLGAHVVHKGMTTGDIEKVLAKGGSKVAISSEKTGGFTGQVKGVPYTVSVPVQKDVLTVKDTSRNSHSGEGVSADTDTQEISATVWDTNFLERVEFRATWSDRHHLGVPMSAVAQHINDDYGQPLVTPSNGLNLTYCFDESGKQVMSGDCGGNNTILVEISGQKCVDPKTATSLTESGSPMYAGLICELTISYVDHRVSNAFGSQLSKLVYQKFIALHGEPDPR
ncbi:MULTISPECIES: hypothetical protein [Rhizobium]|uniref:Uncharacterized protein n=1 Tax=Rhizobium aouanii TaxID=3118145 RepID=A0ABU8CLM1_9HYPH|nr:hypothetical protein [Rhizobium acaciae]MCW1410749.1 hypothetical protein [Rhizobium acaciae]MCW1742952.1 hypothetical protein [Rhizobium acaciae]MCW1750148.1 hypothetical protein [Rhizobium acaciae]